MRVKNCSLDIDAQRALLRGLIPLADRCWDLADQTRQAGWDVIWPKIAFESSFGSLQDTIDHRRYLVESVKARICNPNIRFRLPEGKPYTSEYLEQLKAERDIRSKGLLDTEKPPVWEKELNACRRQMALFRHSNRSEFDRRLAAVQKEQERRRQREIELHQTGISQQFGGAIEQHAALYRMILESEAAPLGFRLDMTRSSERYCVLSKRLIDGWDLCLTPEPLAWHPGRNEGQACIVLSLQADDHRRELRSAIWNRVLIIEYAELIPYFEFSYKSFHSLDELEIVVLARMFLLSLVFDSVENALLEGLAGLMNSERKS